MNKKPFLISDWLPSDNLQTKNAQVELMLVKKSNPGYHGNGKKVHSEGDTELIIQCIESQKIDLTEQYSDWRDIGFAFADEYGEIGRIYFHRVSYFNPNYSQDECDKQYDKCLGSNGHGIGIHTFYYKAKMAGVDISKKSLQKSTLNPVKNETDNSFYPEELLFNTPKISPDLFANLPEILFVSCNMFKEGTERDVFLIGAITVISACLPNIFGLYFNESYTAHLYSFITAPPGSGKGTLKWARYFGAEIHRSIVDESKLAFDFYQEELDRYNQLNKAQRAVVIKPPEPKRKMFFIPANSSSSAFIQALADNDFKGLVFETEADSLSNTLKQDWGNFSDVLRKAFHHENTTMFRRKDNEYIEIEDPHLAVMLSGTPRQVHNMMPDTENGLFSRFLYYAFEDISDFRNPFMSFQNTDYINFFKNQGSKLYKFSRTLADVESPIEFRYTPEQGISFTHDFNIMFNRNRMILGNDFNANIRRLGLITFRISMVLSALRIMENGEIRNPMICSDIDFQAAMNIAFTLEKHAIAVFQNLPNNNLKGIKLKFYHDLPAEFNRQKYLEIAAKLDIKEKTAEKYISIFCQGALLNHEHNKYSKVLHTDQIQKRT